jgi:hypothetical protein
MEEDGKVVDALGMVGSSWGGRKDMRNDAGGFYV